MKLIDLLFIESMIIGFLVFLYIIERKQKLFYKERSRHWKDEWTDLYFATSDKPIHKNNYKYEMEFGIECSTCKEVESNVFAEYCSHCKCQF